ncbi:MAG: hypothetical protein KAY37_02090 [Phycisphaerae bacterium]|nr:hypothetical protein [Phycisphaerae bacterium]
MAFASGPVSFLRFMIDGSLPTDITDKLVQAVNSRAFGKSGVQSDGTQSGWIGPRHLFETEIAAEHIACGPFVHLAVRIDRLKAPANVVKAYIRLEEETALQTGGREFLNRGEKRQAREAALIRADQETRAGGFRRMKAYPLLIDLEHQMVYLGNSGPSVADKVMQLFYDTFGRGLEPVDPERVAVRIMERARKTRALESLTPFTLVTPPEGYGEAAVGFAGTDLNFLGKEFLTWLWYRIDADEGPLKVRTGDEVTVMIDKIVRLKCDFGLTGTDVITADSPANLPEARAALRIGKQPTKMGLIVGAPAGEFRFTLDGMRLAVSGLTLPEDETEQDVRARLEQRFESITDVANLLDALFEMFLLSRTDRNWSRDLRSMSAWAAGQPEKTQLRAASA